MTFKEEIRMEYIYGALLLHSAKQPLTEEGVKKVLSASGTPVDDLKVKQLVAALQGVDIDEAVKQAAVVAAAPAASGAPAGEAKKEAAPDEKSEAEKEAEASAGLAALFG